MRQNTGSGQSSQGQVSLESVISTVCGMFNSCWKGILTSKDKSASLPMNRFQSSVLTATDQRPSSVDLFLHLCIPYRKYATRMVHVLANNIPSDQVLFKELKCQYDIMRGKWSSVLSLRKLDRIQFVRFELHNMKLVDIQGIDIPPKEKGNEYQYRPMPAETIPPVGENYMMHLYEHPEDAEDVPVCLERLPKKLKEPLSVCRERRTSLGWGIYYLEGFHWTKFWIFGFLSLVVSICFGVCWSIFRHDLQGGFGVTACMMVGITFTNGVVQAALDPR